VLAARAKKDVLAAKAEQVVLAARAKHMGNTVGQVEAIPSVSQGGKFSRFP